MNALHSLGYLRTTARTSRTISAIILSSVFGWRTSIVGDIAADCWEAVGIAK